MWTKAFTCDGFWYSPGAERFRAPLSEAEVHSKFYEALETIDPDRTAPKSVVVGLLTFSDLPVFNAWEAAFLDSVQRRERLSDRQIETIWRIYGKAIEWARRP